MYIGRGRRRCPQEVACGGAVHMVDVDECVSVGRALIDSPAQLAGEGDANGATELAVVDHVVAAIPGYRIIASTGHKNVVVRRSLNSVIGYGAVDHSRHSPLLRRNFV